jgi:hypothetical protein
MPVHVASPGMSQVPIPTHLLEKACTPSRYKVLAFLNVSLGTAPVQKGGKSRHSSKSAASRVLDRLRGSQAGHSHTFDAFHFFGNTTSSSRVDLAPVAEAHFARAHSASGGAAHGPQEAGRGSGDALLRGGCCSGKSDASVAGRPAVLCKIDMEQACELCLHSDQPLQNLNVVAELVVAGGRSAL